jgi:hypothetical protein
MGQVISSRMAWEWNPKPEGRIRPHFKSKVADVRIFPPDGYYVNWYVTADDDYEKEFKDSLEALAEARLICGQ